MSDVQHPLEERSIAVTLADAPEDWHEPFRQGTVFEIGDYCPALKEGDEGFGKEDWIQQAFYYGHINGGYNNLAVPASLVEPYTEPAMPTHAEVVAAISSALHSADDGFSVHYSQVSGNSIVVAARSDAGFPFTFEVNVSDLERM